MTRRQLPILLMLLLAPAACGSELRDAAGDTPVTDTMSPDDTREAPDTAEPDDTSVVAPDSEADAAADAVEDTSPPPPAPWVFGAAELPTLELTIDAGAWSELALGAPPVPGNLSRPGDEPPLPVLVSVTAAGDDGLAGKVSWRVELLPELATLPEDLAGTPWIDLDAMRDDPSQLRAQLGRELYAGLGVPVPRGGYVRLVVNGEAWGLYGAQEPIESGAFVARLGASTPIVLGARARENLGPYDFPDVYPWKIPWFTTLLDPDGAAEGALAALVDGVAALEAAQAEPGPETAPFLEGLAALVDVDAYLDFVASDLLLSRWSYAAGSRTYALVGHSGAPWHFVADGLASAFGAPSSPWWRSGRIQKLCLDDLPCRSAFGQRVRDLRARFEAEGLLYRGWAMASAVRLWSADDPRRTFDDQAVQDGQLAVLRGLEDRLGWLELELDCSEPALVDHDQDGASACLDDCDDDDALVHPGAEERCNQRDDDCDGIIDDGEGCEPCSIRAVPTGARVAVCFPRETWADARRACQALGGDLVSAGDASAWAGVRDAALTTAWQDYWIGLNDAADEGQFTWSDGSAAGFATWNGGEPNDAGGNEDCAQLTAWSGSWNDLDCGRRLSYLCGLPPVEDGAP